MTNYFSEVETTREYKGYFCSVAEALVTVTLGTICGLRNASQIHQWAENERVRDFLAREYGIARIPCYWWLLSLLRLIEPKSFNRCFIGWVQSLLPADKGKLTLSLDGKAIRSTGKMGGQQSPLLIVSAHLAEPGMTFAQQAVAEGSNEIPALRELLELLDIEGCLVAADALHCQKETAQAIRAKSADYLLCAKENQSALKQDIADYVADAALRSAMGSFETHEKNGGRIECRRAYATCEVAWLADRHSWPDLACIGAIHSRATTAKGTAEQWRYYISSRKLDAKGLLRHARNEWSVESLHWLLDVHFEEDYCRIGDLPAQQNLNIVRKVALNCLRLHKSKTASKLPLSKIMLDCLLEPLNILPILANIDSATLENEN
jgi:predicted transposase YbfD/YdcC